MAQEVELKLALATEHQVRFLRHPLLKQALDRHVDNLDNIYYDTPDFALRRRGIALRLRRKGRLWLQTVKLAGKSAGGLSSRPEWEVPYHGHFDFAAVDVVPAREWLADPALLARIVPICETRFRRITWRFAAPPGVVLLTLDRGWITGNGRREAISELELELDGAPVAAIFDLATQLAARVALTPAAASKAERGYRLAIDAPAGPCPLGAVSPAPTISPDAAFRRIALSCLECLQRNHPGAVGSDDTEYIKQMRIAARRLRTALRLFAPALPQALVDALRDFLSALMQPLRRLHDLDVVRDDIVKPVLTALPDQPSLPALLSTIDKRRATARARTIALLAAPDYGFKLLTALAALHVPPAAEADKIALADFTRAHLDRRLMKLNQLGSAATIDDPASLQVLHIGVKRLLSALELLSPHALPQLAAAQDRLGQLLELRTSGATLLDCADDQPALREAVALVRNWHRPRRASLLAEISRDLPRLARLRLPPSGLALSRKEK
jgi:inorganic triphosphatase YgiF